MNNTNTEENLDVTASKDESIENTSDEVSTEEPEVKTQSDGESENVENNQQDNDQHKLNNAFAGVKKEAHEKGYDKGYTTGYEAAKRELQSQPPPSINTPNYQQSNSVNQYAAQNQNADLQSYIANNLKMMEANGNRSHSDFDEKVRPFVLRSSSDPYKMSLFQKIALRGDHEALYNLANNPAKMDELLNTIPEKWDEKLNSLREPTHKVVVKNSAPPVENVKSTPVAPKKGQLSTAESLALIRQSQRG